MVTRTEAAMVKGEESVTKAAETVAASGAKNDEHTLQLTKESAQLLTEKQEAAEAADTLSSLLIEIATKQEGNHNQDHINLIRKITAKKMTEQNTLDTVNDEIDLRFTSIKDDD